MDDPTRKAQTAARLRADLDAGRGQDKVAHPDPAAAPLGTDDEAAGTPVDQEQVRMAQDEELRDRGMKPFGASRKPDETGDIRVPGVDSTSADTRGEPAITPSGPGRSGLVMVAVIAIIALLVLVAVYP